MFGELSHRRYIPTIEMYHHRECHSLFGEQELRPSNCLSLEICPGNSSRHFSRESVAILQFLFCEQIYYCSRQAYFSEFNPYIIIPKNLVQFQQEDYNVIKMSDYYSYVFS